MSRRHIFFYLFLLFIIFFIYNKQLFIFSSELSDGCDFEQNFSAPVGSLVFERNGEPYSIASAFLINKDDGVFTTADHFLDQNRSYIGGKTKLFFECRSYLVDIQRTADVHDAANIYVTSSFNSERWPDPYPVSKDTVVVGDTVYVQGIHTHPWSLHLQNISNGHNDKPVNIFKDYYKKYSEKNRKSEFIFDNMKGVVFETNDTQRVFYGDGAFLDKDMRRIRTGTNLFFSLETERNHKISFGGLSGGPVLNDKGEIVGIVTLERRSRNIFSNSGSLPVYKIIHVTPVTEVPVIFRYHQDW